MAISTIGASGLDSTVSQIGKNLVTNGGANVSQRGVNATIVSGFDSTTNSYIADRFLASGGGSPQNRADLKHVSSGGPAGFPNFIRYDITTAEAAVAAGEYSVIEQRVEAFNCLPLGWGATGAKSAALSFYIRSPKTGTHSGYVYNNNTNRTWTFEFTVDAANTWEKKSVTIDPDTTGGAFTAAVTEGIRVGIPIICGSTYQTAAGSWTSGSFRGTSNQQNLADNTANNIDITGVQLEVGSVATDFEHEDIGETKRKCERRFRRLISTDDFSIILRGGSALSTTTCGFGLDHRGMASEPTATFGAVNVFDLIGGGLGITTTNLTQTAARSDADQSEFVATVSSGLTAGFALNLHTRNTTTAYIDLSCEL
jgi:hypothetical protein